MRFTIKAKLALTFGILIALLAGAGALGIDGSEGISAAVVATGPGLLAQAVLHPPGQLASDVTVRP